MLDVVSDGLDGERALALLTGPIGRVDPVSLRQLRRTLRRVDPGDAPRDFADLLVDALDPRRPVPGDVPDQLARALKLVRKVLAAASRSQADGLDPRFTLWQAWHQTGLQRRWLAAAERAAPRASRPAVTSTA